MENQLKEGETLFADGRIDEAAEFFLSAVEKGENNKEAYNNLGVIAIEKRDVKAAIECFTRSLEIDPFYKDALINYTDLLKTLNQLHIAVPLLEKIVEVNPDDKEISQLLAEIKLGEGESEKVCDIKRYNETGIKYLNCGELEMAKENFVKSLAMDNNQPEIREKLLSGLYAILKQNSFETKRNITNIKPKFFDKEKERNPKRDLFLKYVPEEIISEKTGLNILFISDFEIAGNQTRMMKLINNHTTHKARNVIFNRDYLNYGEDLVLDTEENLKETQELIRQADFFHFSRLIPSIPGIDLCKYLRRNNCMIDYFGGDIKFNKKNVVAYHKRTGVFGLNKYDFEMYKGAEFLMYHIPVMFDVLEYDNYDIDLGFYQKSEIIIGHSPTNPGRKGTHYILPIIERINQKVQQSIKMNLIMGKSNVEAIKEKAKCDIYIDQVVPESSRIAGCPGQNSYESLALGKVTITSMDNFYLSFFPDVPIFSATIENLEGIILNILNNPSIVKEKMKNTKLWLKQFSSTAIMRKYLHIYQYIITGNQFVNSFDRFFNVLSQSGK